MHTPTYQPGKVLPFILRRLVYLIIFLNYINYSYAHDRIDFNAHRNFTRCSAINTPVTADASSPIFLNTVSNELTYLDLLYKKGSKVDWAFRNPPGYSLYNSYANGIEIGDVNGDSFDDALYILESDDKSHGLMSIHYGSITGLEEKGLWNVKFEKRGFSEPKAMGLGDVNGDGFDDIGIMNQSPLIVEVYYGGAKGPEIYPDDKIDMKPYEIPYSWFQPYKVGDVNGDGFDDLIIYSFEENHLGFVLYGSKQGFSSPKKWPSANYRFSGLTTLEKVEAADINNDGYSDVLFHVNDKVFLFLGSGNGLNMNPYQEFNFFGNFLFGLITGDFDGDNFDDLIGVAHIGATTLGTHNSRKVVFWVPGSASGLEDDSLKILIDINNEFYDYLFLYSMGDINGDKISDFAVSQDIFLGTKNLRNWRYNLMGYNTGKHIRTIGDVNGDGHSDFCNRINPDEIFYSPAIPPISCPDSIMVCKNNDNQYRLPIIDLNDSFYRSITFSINPVELPFNWARNGSGRDASGEIKSSALIVWSAMAINDATKKCSTKFVLKPDPITAVKIKSGSAHARGAPNTFYIGYGASEFRIEAIPAGSAGPYTYLWSNGSQEKNPRISEKIPGDYKYWVEMKNKYGCSSSDTTIIRVENALCSSPLVDLVMTQYPYLMQHTLLANLLKSNSKIAVCKDGQTLCLNKSSVDLRILRSGYSLGPCVSGIIPPEAFISSEVNEIFSGAISLQVFPNPSSNLFQLNIVSLEHGLANIVVYDVTGKVVDRINKPTNTTVIFGERLKRGIYILEAKFKDQRKTVKIIKTR